jgi:hypothetical protein
MVLNVRFLTGADMDYEPFPSLPRAQEAHARSTLQVAAIEATESLGQRKTDQ